jgi:hypothetical protein
MFLNKKKWPAAEYRRPLRVAFCWQVFFLLLGSTIFDGGWIAAWCAVVCIAFWTVVGIIVLRRPYTPKKSDLVFISCGVPCLSMLGFMLMAI